MRKLFTILLLLHAHLIVPQDMSLPLNAASSIKSSEASNRGVVNISLPLLEVNGGGVEIPISLDYYAGGIKVKQIASPVGLGWSLNAGGSITRSIRGKADDNTISGFLHNDFMPSGDKRKYFSLLKKGLRKSGRSFYYYYDLEPDVYSFNFLGYSGKFTYNKKTKTFVQYPSSLLKITPSFDDRGIIWRWIVKTPEGITCVFGGSSYANDTFVTNDRGSRIFDSNSIDLFTSTLEDHHIDSWHITQITDANGNRIFFDYQINGEWIEPENDKIFSVGGSVEEIKDFQKDRILKHNSISVTRRRSPFLKKIRFPNGRIEFRLSNNTREDATKLKKLESIAIFDKFDNPIKAYEFDYTYFKGKMSSQINNIKSLHNSWFTKAKKSIIMKGYVKPSFSISLDEITKRLSLKKITQKHYLSNKEIDLYKFEYYNKHTLPDRFSYAQDYWGFYNGVDNSTLIPKVRKKKNNGWVVFGEANRSVQIEKAKACSLRRIIYGSGGSKEFFYESNTSSTFKKEKSYGWESVYDNIFDTKTQSQTTGGLRVCKVVTKENNNNVSIIDYKYNSFNTSKSSGYTNYLPIKVSGSTSHPYNVGISSHSPRNFLISPPFTVYKNITKLFNGGERGKIEYTYGYTPYEYKFTNPYRWYRYFYSDRDGRKLKEWLERTSASRKGFVKFLKLDLAWRMGTLEKTTAYGFKNGKFTKTSEDIFNYESNNTRRISDIGMHISLRGMSIISYPKIYEKEIRLVTRFYDLLTEDYRLKSKKSTFFLESGTKSKTVTTNYFYEYKPLKESKIVTLDGGKKYTTKLFYPEDVNRLGYDPISAAEKNNIQKLIQKNRTSEIIQTEKKVQDSSGKILSNTAQRTLFYEPHPNIIIPNKEQAIKGFFSSDNKFKTNVNFHHYDKKGNIIEVSSKKGIHTVNIYGYNDELLIATIKNVTYTEVKPYEKKLKDLSNQDNDNCLSDSCKEQVLRNALNALRDVFPNAMITTYTYDPLIGKTSETNVNGLTTYFTYDEFNRLKSKRDHNYNLIADYVYGQKK